MSRLNLIEAQHGSASHNGNNHRLNTESSENTNSSEITNSEITNNSSDNQFQNFGHYQATNGRISPLPSGDNKNKITLKITRSPRAGEVNHEVKHKINGGGTGVKPLKIMLNGNGSVENGDFEESDEDMIDEEEDEEEEDEDDEDEDESSENSDVHYNGISAYKSSYRNNSPRVSTRLKVKRKSIENEPRRSSRRISSKINEVSNSEISENGSVRRSSRRIQKRVHSSSEEVDDEEEEDEIDDEEEEAEMSDEIQEIPKIQKFQKSTKNTNPSPSRLSSAEKSGPYFPSAITNETVPYEMETLQAALRSTIEGNDSRLDKSKIDTTYRALQDYSIALRHNCLRTTQKIRNLAELKESIIEKLDKNEITPVEVFVRLINLLKNEKRERLPT